MLLFLCYQLINFLILFFCRLYSLLLLLFRFNVNSIFMINNHNSSYVYKNTGNAYLGTHIHLCPHESSYFRKQCFFAAAAVVWCTIKKSKEREREKMEK